MADQPGTTIVCPHCGDATQHEIVLSEFTCGACDKPFSPPNQMTPPKPVRAHTLICNIGADTARDLAAELRHLAFLVESDKLSVGCSGGYGSGSMYSYRVAPEQTHDAYFQQVDAWLAAKDEEKLHAG